MNYKNSDNENIISKKIIEKDKLKKEYDKKIGDIKFNYGIDFSIEYIKKNNINYIVFNNIKYKNKIMNANVYYSSESNNFNAITYEITNSKKENINYNNLLLDEIVDEYKLNLAVEEIEKVNLEYRQQLKKIDKKYSKLEKNKILSNSSLELKKSLKS